MAAAESARVLIVGDEEAEFDGLAAALHTADCQTEMVRGVGAACAALRIRDFLAVVADLPAPDMDAFAILRAARRRTPAARVIVVLPAVPLGVEPLLDALRREAFGIVRHPLDTAAIGRLVLDAIGETRADSDIWFGRGVAGGIPDQLDASLAATGVGQAEAWGRIFTLLADPGPLGEESLYGMVDAARVATSAVGAWLLSPPTQRAGSSALTACGVDAGSAAIAQSLARDTSAAGRPLSLVVGANGAPGVYEAVPLGAGGEAGALVLIFPPGQRLADDDRHLLAALAAQLSGRRPEPAREDLREHVSEMVVRSLSRALSLYDPAVERHSRRVGVLSVDLALAAGVTPASTELREIERGAVLHDIGTLGLSSQARDATPSEINDLRERPERGYRIVSDIPYLQRVAGLIRASGEHWDGSGNPRRLTGEDIPFGSRLIVVADAWDRLTFERAPGAALPASRALEEIRGRAGTHFDPRVVEALQRVAIRWSGGRRFELPSREAAA